MIQFDDHIFQIWVGSNHQVVMWWMVNLKVNMESNHALRDSCIAEVIKKPQAFTNDSNKIGSSKSFFQSY